MPKIKQDLEDEEEDDFEEDEYEENESDELEQMEQSKNNREGAGKDREKIPRIETRGRKKKEEVKEEVKRRFGIIAPQPLRYVDTETNEVIAEADLNDNKSMSIAILAAISDLKEQLERVEVQIGAITS